MKPIRKFAIVGGGTAGWIAAAVLVNEFKGRCQVQLVESEEIGTIGVGESTIPPFLELLGSLGIDEKDFIQQTQASFKLGIQFVDWRVKGESYFHPFGTISAGMDQFRFYHSWLKANRENHLYTLQSFSPSSIMAEYGKFALPAMLQKTPLREMRYALHLDAKLVAQYLRRYAEARGAIRTEGRVVNVVKTDEQRVSQVVLESGIGIDADFFIDCTGFSALLIEKNLGSMWRDWSEYLPCDSAVTVQTERVGDVPPYTRATAKDAGWIWRIPLQTRTGNGYVYSSRFLDDQKAVDTLLANVEGKRLTEPNLIRFKTGVREEPWKGNCLSLGLASGFIEPLESTAIHLVVRGMVHFMRHFPDRECDLQLIKEFNRRMRADYEEIRDFIVLHYCLTQRNDSDFWRWQKSADWPPSLRDTVDYFSVQGGVPEIMDPLFAPVSWRSVCEGMGLRPQKYSHLIDEVDEAKVRQHFVQYLHAVNELVKRLPSHQDFLTEHCPSVTP